MSSALVNHEVRRKEKESSSSSTTAEALTVREICSDHRKGKRAVGKSTTGNHKLERTNVLSARKKDIERLIVQGSRKIKDNNSEANFIMRMIVLMLTHL